MRGRGVVLAALTAVAACGPRPATVVDPATGAKTEVEVRADDRAVAFKTDGGRGAITATGRGETPTMLPAHLPPYPGARWTGAMGASAGGREGVSGGVASFVTADPTERVVAFYRAALTRAGLEETSSGELDGATLVSAERGVDVTAQIAARPTPEGGSEVELVWTAGR